MLLSVGRTDNFNMIEEVLSVCYAALKCLITLILVSWGIYTILRDLGQIILFPSHVVSP